MEVGYQFQASKCLYTIEAPKVLVFYRILSFEFLKKYLLCLVVDQEDEILAFPSKSGHFHSALIQLTSRSHTLVIL